MEVVEFLYRKNKPLLIGIMNKCLGKGAFPTSWKMADWILFNKVDKDRTDESSYCPICLLPAWSKVLDKLVTNRLVFHALSQGFMDKNQFGFTQEKGQNMHCMNYEEQLRAVAAEIMTAASSC